MQEEINQSKIKVGLRSSGARQVSRILSLYTELSSSVCMYVVEKYRRMLGF